MNHNQDCPGLRRRYVWLGAGLLCAIMAAPACRTRAAEPTSPTGRADANPSALAVAPATSQAASSNLAKPWAAGSLPGAPTTSGISSVAPPNHDPTAEREARPFVPSGLGRGESVPLLLVLHGLGGSGEQIERDLDLRSFARERKFAYLAPDGTLDPMGRRFWDAGPICCNFLGSPVDDVQRLSRLLEQVSSSAPVDPKRVFVVGYSNGGFMAHRLACEKSNLVRAIVSMAAVGPAAPQTCEPAQSVAVLEIHGDQDNIVPYLGGHLFSRTDFPRSPSVQDGLAAWARLNECSGQLRAETKLDLIDNVPGAETSVLAFQRCAKSDVQLWRVGGGAHVMRLGNAAKDGIWRFLTGTG